MSQSNLRNHVLDEDPDRQGGAAFFKGGLSGRLKTIMSHSCFVRCKKINNGTAALLRQWTNAADWSVSHYIVPVKNQGLIEK